MTATARVMPASGETASLEILPSAEDVIAIRLRETIDLPALQRLVDMVERSISANDRTHFFVEIAFNVFDVRLFVDFVQCAAPWLGMVQRFGRIAIVGDLLPDLAVATLDRMMPDLDCETFHSRDRERALAWVEGRNHRRGGSLPQDRSDIARQGVSYPWMRQRDSA